MQTTNRFIAKNIVKDYFTWYEEKMYRGGDLNDYGCKAFILKSGNFTWPNYSDFDLISDRMCVSNRDKDKDSSPCYNEGNTTEITKLDNNTYVFPISKSFITGNLNSGLVKHFEKIPKGKFKFRADSTEIALAVFALDWVTDGETKAGRKKNEYKKEREYRKNAIQELFYTPYKRLEKSSNNSGIGIGIRPILYTSPLEDDKKANYALAEVFFVDMKNNNKTVGVTVYGYIDFFKSGHGGLNVYVPTCYSKTSKKEDGCSFSNKKDIKHWVRKSQMQKNGYGKPFFKFSLAKYIPPPEEPKAPGIPLSF